MDYFFFLLYFIANFCAFLAYGWDKKQAKISGVRIPEKDMLLFAFIAPFGAYFGMIYFRHKVSKISFNAVVPLFLLLHILIFIVSHKNLFD